MNQHLFDIALLLYRRSKLFSFQISIILFGILMATVLFFELEKHYKTSSIRTRILYITSIFTCIAVVILQGFVFIRFTDQVKIKSIGCDLQNATSIKIKDNRLQFTYNSVPMDLDISHADLINVRDGKTIPTEGTISITQCILDSGEIPDYIDAEVYQEITKETAFIGEVYITSNDKDS